jgi:hypothetical protein
LCTIGTRCAIAIQLIDGGRTQTAILRTVSDARLAGRPHWTLDAVPASIVVLLP